MSSVPLLPHGLLPCGGDRRRFAGRASRFLWRGDFFGAVFFSEMKDRDWKINLILHQNTKTIPINSNILLMKSRLFLSVPASALKPRLICRARIPDNPFTLSAQSDDAAYIGSRMSPEKCRIR